MFDGTFEQSTILRTGPDGLTRVIVRSSWRERESVLVEAYEAELVVLRRWEEFHEEAAWVRAVMGVVCVLSLEIGAAPTGSLLKAVGAAGSRGAEAKCLGALDRYDDRVGNLGKNSASEGLEAGARRRPTDRLRHARDCVLLHVEAHGKSAALEVKKNAAPSGRERDRVGWMKHARPTPRLGQAASERIVKGAPLTRVRLRGH